MKAYFELRERLAELYASPAEWRRVATDAGTDVGDIVFQGSSLGVWSNILNALRTQKRLDGLTTVLSRENPQVVPLVLAYVAEAANGEGAVVDLPALRAVALPDADLQAGVLAQSLDFAQTLPSGLLDMALADTQPTLDDVDAALQGTYTRAAKQKLEQFRREFAGQLAALNGPRQTAEGELATLKAKIDTIEKARPPVTPVMPDTSRATDQQRQFLEKQHTDQMTAYRAAHAAFEADRNSLGSLRAKADSLRDESARLAAAIANLKMQKEVSERAFEEDVAQARDRDLLLALDQILDKASAAFHAERKAFKAFWTLLGAGTILELFERIISAAATGTEAGRRFSAHAQALAPSLDDSLAEIARRSLAGPLVVQRALGANRQSLAALRERLAALPTPVLEERRRRARELIERRLPPIPDFAELEKPNELDETARKLAGMHAAVQDSIAEMQSEIAGEPPDLRRAVDAAETDAAATLETIGVVAAENAEALRRTRMLWTLMSRAAGSAQVPASLARLCSALAQDFERRAGVDVDAVLTDAAALGLGLDEARALLAEHLLTGYIASAQQLGQRLAETEKHLAAIVKAGKDVEDRSGLVEQRYRTRLTAVALLSVAPLVGLVAAMFAWHLVARLQPLVASDKPAYVRLGSFAIAALACAAGLSGAVAAGLGGMMFAQSNAIDASAAPLVLALSAACVVTFALSVRNLLAILAHVRARSRPAGAATA